jgi:hypothetical protein
MMVHAAPADDNDSTRAADPMLAHVPHRWTPPMPLRCRCWPRAALMDVDDADADAGPRATSMDAADANVNAGHVPHSLMDAVDADGMTTPTPTSCRT